MDRKRQKLTPEKNDVQKDCQDAKITALEKKLENMENKLKLNDVQKECQSEKITTLERKFEHMENKLKLVIAELEQVKEERACNKINFETEKCELESKIDQYKEQCTELQDENKRLQKYFQNLESANTNVEEKSLKTLTYNTDLTRQITEDENKRLQKYCQNLESANTNVEEKSQKTLTYNTDLTRQITEVNESNDDALAINSLPNEIILHVFVYLEQNQLGQIARVCSRWNMLTKSPILWKKVNVKFSPSDRCQTTVAEYSIKLPSCVTSISLDFVELDDWIGYLDFAELCLRLQEKCPHLEELILTDSVLSNNLSSIIEFCSQFLQDVQNLSFHYSEFRCDNSTEERSGMSKIKILELLYCDFYCSSNSPFSKMPHLKQLHLYSTYVDDSWFQDDISFLNQLRVLNLGNTQITAETFQAIQNHGLNLEDFYVCFNRLQDHEITLNDSSFLHLKTICLVDTWVTCEGVVSLIQSCPSLQNVYVDKAVAVAFAVHPFLAANRCKSGIVRAIGEIHIHNVDYSHT